jgi:outer membrane receptor protein involved in Fe transport
MASYRIDDNYSIQMNVTNLLDTTYYENSYFASPSENHVTPGAGRTFTFVARANF